MITINSQCGSCQKPITWKGTASNVPHFELASRGTTRCKACYQDSSALDRQSRPQGTKRPASRDQHDDEPARQRQRLEASASTFETQKSSSTDSNASIPISRHFHELLYNEADDTTGLREYFDSCVAEHDLSKTESTAVPSLHDPKWRSFVLRDLCCQVTDYSGTIDRFVNVFLPALHGHTGCLRKGKEPTWMKPFLVDAGRSTEQDFEQAHEHYESNRRVFVKQMEARFVATFAAAIHHQYYHLVTDGVQCEHLLTQDGCPDDTATSSDYTAQGARSALEWDVERMVNHLKSATIVESHPYWSITRERVARFRHELGMEYIENNCHPCHALMADLAQLRPVNGIQRDQQLHTRLVEKLDAKDLRIEQLELRVTALSNLESANQRLKHQVICAQARGLFEQLSATTRLHNPNNDFSSARWRQWVDDVVWRFWRMPMELQKSHPLYTLKVDAKFTGAKELTTWMHGLYRDYSDEIHNIDTRLLIDGSSMHKRREKILLHAMNPTSFDGNGDVDIEKERERYWIDASDTRDHIPLELQIQQHETNQEGVRDHGVSHSTPMAATPRSDSAPIRPDILRGQPLPEQAVLFSSWKQEQKQDRFRPRR